MNKKPKKPEMVLMVNEALGEREFELSHAQRLVALEAKMSRVNWVLPEKSKYEIVDGNINRIGNS